MLGPPRLWRDDGGARAPRAAGRDEPRLRPRTFQHSREPREPSTAGDGGVDAASLANPIALGPVRFTVISPTLIRAEYAFDSAFTDATTFTAVAHPVATTGFKTSKANGFFAIVPLQSATHNATETRATLERRVFGGADGQFTLYEDEGNGASPPAGGTTDGWSYDATARTVTIVLGARPLSAGLAIQLM